MLEEKVLRVKQRIHSHVGAVQKESGARSGGCVDRSGVAERRCHRKVDTDAFVI